MQPSFPAPVNLTTHQGSLGSLRSPSSVVSGGVVAQGMFEQSLFSHIQQTEALDVCDHLRAPPNTHHWSRPGLLTSSKPPTHPPLNTRKKNRKQLQPPSCLLTVSFPEFQHWQECPATLMRNTLFLTTERSFQIQSERVCVLWHSVFLDLLFSSYQTPVS